MTHRDMDHRTAAGTLSLATCLGGGTLALAGAVGLSMALVLLGVLVVFGLVVLALCVWLSE